MTRLRKVRGLVLRAFGFLWRSRAEREMAAEFESHLAMHIDDNIRAGMTPEEARRQALVRFGPVEAIKDSHRDQRGVPILETVLRDLRYSVRILRRHPAFSAAAIGTLALGIAASATVFSIVDAVFLRPLPYPDPARVVGIKGSQGQAFTDFRNHLDLRAQYRTTRSFAALGLYSRGGMNFGGETAARITVATVTPGFFDVLGARPIAGRFFTAADMAANPRVVIVSHGFWRAHLHQRQDAIGTRVILNAREFEVLGIMPPGVAFPQPAQLWIPPEADTQVLGTVPSFTLVGRLRDGVSVQEARAELLALTKWKNKQADALAVVPLHDALVGDLRPVAGLVSAGAALLLLIACINAANLLLARVAARRREFVVRRALGASRAQLVRQVLAESLTLSALAGAAAIPLAIITLRLAVTLLPASLHGLDDIGIDGRTTAAVAAMAFVTAMLFGLAPSISVRATSGADALRAVASMSMGRFWTRLRSGLLVVEVAIALVLLTGAATLVITVAGLMRADVGARGDRALVLEIALPRLHYKAPSAANEFHAALRREIAQLPGVEHVGATSVLPLAASPLLLAETIALEERPRPEGQGRSPSAVTVHVSPGYLEAIGIDLLAGRTFHDTDGIGPRRVVVVSESWARTVSLTPAQLVGRRAVLHGAHDEEIFAEIVGVVRDVRTRSVEDKFSAAIYRPAAENSHGLNNAFIVVKASGDPRRLVPAIAGAAARVNPALPLFNVRTYDDVRATHFSDQRFAMITMVVFGSLALTLAMVGLYGMIAYLVQMRTREIGIRIAVGAAPSDVRRQVIGSGLAHAAAGLLLGGLMAAGASRMIAGRVPGLSGLQPEVVALLCAVVLIVTVLAAWIPARRATGVDPLLALRAE